MKPAGPPAVKRSVASCWSYPEDRITRTPGSISRRRPKVSSPLRPGIEHHDVHPLAVVAEERYSRRAVLGLKHHEPLAHQDFAHHLAHHGLVVDHQHGRAGPAPGRGRGRFGLCLVRARSEQQPEHGALARRALHTHRAAVSAHDTQHRGQPQPAPGELGREERLEDAVHRRGIHARAVVRHLERDVAAGGERLAARAPQRGVFGRDVADAGRDRHRSTTLADRLGRVDDQVHQHLLQLAHVGVHRRQRGIEARLEPHALRQRDLQQGQVLAHERTNVRGPHHEVPAPRVGEHLAREVGGALDGARRLLDVPAHGAALRQPRKRQRGVPQDRGEQVVEVVGDTPRQDAQALFLGRAAQRLLRRAPLRDVDRHGQHGRTPAAGEGERDPGGLQPAHPARSVGQELLEVELRLAAAKHVAVVRERAARLVRGSELGVGAADQRAQRVLVAPRLDRRRDLPAHEDEQLAVLGPEPHGAVVGLDRRHADRLVADEERRSQPVDGVAGDELHLPAGHELAEHLGSGEQRLPAAQDVLRQAASEGLRPGRRVALVGEVGEAERPRGRVVEGDVEVARRDDLDQALVQRAEEGIEVGHGARGLGDAVGAGLGALAPPREIGDLALALVLALERPRHERQPDHRRRQQVERHQDQQRLELTALRNEADREIGELVGRVDHECQAREGAAQPRSRLSPREDGGGRGEIGEAGDQATQSDGRRVAHPRGREAGRGEPRGDRNGEGQAARRGGDLLLPGQAPGAQQQPGDLQVRGDQRDRERPDARGSQAAARGGAADGGNSHVDGEREPAQRPVAQVRVAVQPVEGTQDARQDQRQCQLQRDLRHEDGQDADRPFTHCRSPRTRLPASRPDARGRPAGASQESVYSTTNRPPLMSLTTIRFDAGKM